MEERRLLVAVALSFVVLIGYRLLFPPVRRAPAAPVVSAPAAAPAPPPTTTATPAPAPAPTAAVVVSEPAPEVADDLERRIELRSPEAIVALTNRGGEVVSWRLLRYLDARGEPEELSQVSVGGLRPLAVTTGRPDVDQRLRTALFRSSAEKVTAPAGGAAEIHFEWSAEGLHATKDLRLRADGLLLDLEVHVEQDGQELPVEVAWGPGVGNPTLAEREVSGYVPPEAVYLRSGVERVAAKKLTEPRSEEGVRWAGVESLYFAALFVTPAAATARLETAALPTLGEQEPEQSPVVWMPTGDAPLVLFVGPKDYQRLEGLGYGLERVVPVGDWIGPLVVPLLALLRWVQGFIGSYGWSIVVLTVLINGAMAPLRHYSIANGIKMAKLSPEMKVIQERYRKVPALDPRRQEMQKEMAALYERHGMSMSTQMAVGCLPIFLTMPFLIAFYRVLTVSIDLRGAEFLWIPDLSQKDPLFITPVLMGVSMVIMQRLTPTTMDPAQQRVMLVMPLVLVVMFFAAPSGLNLYWLVANVCSIIQQAITLRIVHDREAAPTPRTRREKRRA